LEEGAAIWRALAAAAPHERATTLRLIHALAHLVITVQFQGDFAARAALEAEYLRLHEGLDDPRAEALLAFQRGRGALLQFGDYRAAQGSLERSLELLRELGDVWTMAQVVIDLGLVALHQGDTAAARTRYEQGVAMARSIGDRGLLALALNNLGEAARAAGDLAAAEAHYTASLRLHEELGNRPETPRLLHNLGYVALRQGLVTRAVDYFLESLRRFQQLGMKRGMAEGLAGLAAAAACEGRPLEAARRWGAAEALHTSEGTPVWPTDQREQAYYQALARAQVSPSEWEAAWAEGCDQELWQNPDDR
jgi:tetratricopeptide (TPR) repeat protein